MKTKRSTKRTAKSSPSASAGKTAGKWLPTFTNSELGAIAKAAVEYEQALSALHEAVTAVSKASHTLVALGASCSWTPPVSALRSSSKRLDELVEQLKSQK